MSIKVVSVQKSYGIKFYIMEDISTKTEYYYEFFKDIAIFLKVDPVEFKESILYKFNGFFVNDFVFFKNMIDFDKAKEYIESLLIAKLLSQ